MRGRAFARGLRLLAELMRASGLVLGGRCDPARLLAATSRRLLRVLRVEVTISGKVPARGLIVCNHLSYLDVLVLAASGPMRFVAKREVRSWPLFGWLIAAMGTIFVERRSPRSSARTVREIEAALRDGQRVVLFPEGTSSGGASVLPFRSTLLEAAVGMPVRAAAISYELDSGEGDPAEVVAYWKDMVLVPHLLRLLMVRRIRAQVRFDAEPVIAWDRKDLARRLEERVAELHRGAVEPARISCEIEARIAAQSV